MTILDSYQLLNEYFASNSTFCISKNRKEVVKISDDEASENAALICALKEMEKANILKSCSVNGEDYWVLYKSLDSFSQTVEINGFIASAIAGVINNMCDSLGTDSEKCDPMDIGEKDLKNLIFMASKVSVDALKK